MITPGSLRFEIVPFDKSREALEQGWLALFDACEQPCVWYHPLFLWASHALPEAPDTLSIGPVGASAVLKVNAHPEKGRRSTADGLDMSG